MAPSKRPGDDFEDDFVPDDLVALSDDGGDIVYESLSASGDEEPVNVASTSTLPSITPEDAKRAKKRKRRQKEKEAKAKKQRLVESLEISDPDSIASNPPEVLADYLAGLQAKVFTDMSEVELNDIRIPAASIVDTTAWSSPRSLDQFGDFIAKVAPTLKTRLTQKSKDNGAPTLIFVAGGALRVTDITRTLKSKSFRGEKGGDVAKLFARHFKLEEHVQYLKRTKVGAAVGTPGRIGKLLCETDALSTSALTHIMLDASFKDVKKRSMLDQPETRDELFRTVLGSDAIREALRKGKVQIVLF